MSIEQAAKTEKEASQLRGEIREAVKAQTKATMLVAKLLFEIYYATVKVGKEDVPLAEAWGYESFDAYVESDEIGIHYGSAHSLLHIYDELCVRRNFPDGMLPHSITKLKQLMRISRHDRTDKTKIGDWIAKSHEMSCCEFENAVDEEIGERGKRKNLQFQMKWNAIRPVLKNIKLAKEVFGVSTNGEALSQLVEQWAELTRKTAAVKKIMKAG